MNSPDEAVAKACCADLYQSELVRLLLGDTLHPGGLRLTNRLGKLMGLKPGDWVVDLASGRGISASAVSRAFRCRVVGVEFGRAATLEAISGARNTPILPRTFFLQGDAEILPLKSSAFDAALYECSMSIFVDKARAVREVRRTLRPGGRFGISNVTVEYGSLPVELPTSVGQMLCLTAALDTDGYARLLEREGMELLHQEDASAEIIALLDNLESKMGALAAWQSFVGESGLGLPLLEDAPGIIAKLRSLVETGRLGYWLYVAREPG